MTFVSACNMSGEPDTRGRRARQLPGGDYVKVFYRDLALRSFPSTVNRDYGWSPYVSFILAELWVRVIICIHATSIRLLFM